jgi:hypothetical protein
MNGNGFSGSPEGSFVMMTADLQSEPVQALSLRWLRLRLCDGSAISSIRQLVATAIRKAILLARPGSSQSSLASRTRDGASLGESGQSGLSAFPRQLLYARFLATFCHLAEGRSPPN